MHQVHILSRGFRSPNGIAFLFPFIVYRRGLRETGIMVRIFTNLNDKRLCDCDVLFVESRVFSERWEVQGDERVLSDISKLGEQVPLVWFDISDSTGWLQPQVLPFVHWYCKAQLFRDRSLYTQVHYGNRIWADYYHQTEGINDRNPATPRVVENVAFLDRLRGSWNSGLANYSAFGPWFMALRQRIPVNSLLRIPRQFECPNTPRSIPFTCRMGVNYERNTVAHQRRRIRILLENNWDTKKLSRRAYYREMQSSQLVVSPFGFGEITLKDFEATLCGAALLKPDVKHMETWPDLFREGETLLTHSWDLTDFLERIEEAREHPRHLQELARAAQQAYQTALNNERAADGFCARVSAIVHETPVTKRSV